MYALKAAVFNYLTKNQKSSLCSYLRTFAKRYKGLCAEDILDEFIEDETHLLNLDSPHFHFAVENFENEEFLSDLKAFIKAILKDLEYKESQKPYIEAQKQYAKEQRKLAQEYKMGFEKPTQKQLKYYKSLCKANNVEQKEPEELERASKLDLKNWIGELAGDTKED